MRVRVLVSAASLIFVVLSAHAGGGSAVGLAPRVNEPVIGTFVGADVSLTGDHLGLPTSARSIQFDYDGRASTITSSSPLVTPALCLYSPLSRRLRSPACPHPTS